MRLSRRLVRAVFKPISHPTIISDCDNTETWKSLRPFSAQKNHQGTRLRWPHIASHLWGHHCLSVKIIISLSGIAFQYGTRHGDYHTHISTVYPNSNLQRVSRGAGIHTSTVCSATRLPLQTSTTGQMGSSGDASDSHPEHTQFEFRRGHITIFAQSFHGFPQLLQGYSLQTGSDSFLSDRSSSTNSIVWWHVTLKLVRPHLTVYDTSSHV
jgi:hypothetical protein